MKKKTKTRSSIFWENRYLASVEYIVVSYISKTVTHLFLQNTYNARFKLMIIEYTE
jgi:hypothetical protein